MICFGLGWRALQECSCLLATNFKTLSGQSASCHCWLLGDIGAVKNKTGHFIWIVNCDGWLARRPTYKGISCSFLGAANAMSAASGDNSEGAEKHSGTASSARSLIMSGNRIDSRDLFTNEREIIISHGEESYRLRLTSQNKLILTK